MSFLRVGQTTPPDSDYIVIQCGPPSQIYRVERVVSGADIGPAIALRPDSDFAGTPPYYVVGRLSVRTREEYGPVGQRFYWPDYDSTIRLFEARPIPQ